MRVIFLVALFAAAVSAAPARFAPDEGVLSGLLNALSDTTGGLGVTINRLTNDLGQGPKTGF
ncbi:hypothetical protein LPJ66_001376 [Kickxella alabastrina]|uniref:Uncharacterized protein n=1 Tax=Kickxella alabastrina TaxID=61397 RepID=A0ACC1ITD6_9FUNG|nr:hypothetical protein LPJ66_001376 [Kickxella alabastrina]